MGLVNRVLPSDELAAYTNEYAVRLATGCRRRHSPQPSCSSTATSIVTRHRRSTTRAARMAVMMQQADFAEGVAALAEKRPPDFGDPADPAVRRDPLIRGKTRLIW